VAPQGTSPAIDPTHVLCHDDTDCPFGIFPASCLLRGSRSSRKDLRPGVEVGGGAATTEDPGTGLASQSCLLAGLVGEEGYSLFLRDGHWDPWPPSAQLRHLFCLCSAPHPAHLRHCCSTDAHLCLAGHLHCPTLAVVLQCCPAKHKSPEPAEALDGTTLLPASPGSLGSKGPRHTQLLEPEKQGGAP
jgi:hypothetical protein